MITIRPAEERGQAEHGWLSARHSFSFAAYQDPQHMGFGPLRVINDDRIQPAKGFGTHGHENMEIVTYVLEGALAHKDSMGNGSIIRPGEVQRMTAGTGIQHSEFNASDSEVLRLLQIWILPEKDGLEPGYEQKSFPPETLSGTLRLVASRDGREGSVTVHQDVALFAARLDQDQTVRHALATGRKAWLQVARGDVLLNGLDLKEGDGAAIEAEDEVELIGVDGAEILLFDLPAG
ncbi:MAG: pirin family protein [Proteobacteria bacterium]|nr:pirin family protein [Pseudomonadota bacterium]